MVCEGQEVHGVRVALWGDALERAARVGLTEMELALGDRDGACPCPLLSSPSCGIPFATAVCR